MRSRYTAFALGAVDYLVSTHDPASRTASLREGIRQWSEAARFSRLEVLATEAGGLIDSTGVVEYVAHFTQNGSAYTQRERSSFRRIDGDWYYVAPVGGS